MQLTKITPTDKQNKAKNKALDWYYGRETNGKDPNRIFTIAGYAGTGKSTIISLIMEETGLAHDEIAFVAYTGMAASVLLRKGNKSALTIHKLIYDAIPITSPFGQTVGFDFILKKELDSKKIKLIVVDEFSMVPSKMIDDLSTFKVKILALGDPGQLPPIAGGNSLLDNPDVFLDEILRQALDNPIIYFSMLAREKKPIPYGVHGENVQVVQRNQLFPEMFLHADQIIAGKNNTVHALNMYHRRNILNIESPFPIVGDKMICLKNDWNYKISENGVDIFLVNGVIGHIEKLDTQRRTRLYKMDFKPNFMDEGQFESLYVDRIPFMNEKVRNSINHKELFIFRKPIIDSYGIQDFGFGYTITGHKSQGSEFDNLLAFNEVLNWKQHHKWLYTVITRAKENLILVM